jgi:hypothetical protein
MTPYVVIESRDLTVVSEHHTLSAAVTAADSYQGRAYVLRQRKENGRLTQDVVHKNWQESYP